ncbi:hypothetical protein [Nostoc sp.]|uniref:hypothetical protein n=1 Tax=Nostoc sp. TaxID=1180 RepID=UPI002FFD4963
MGIGDWGLGIGDWGLGIGDWGLVYPLHSARAKRPATANSTDEGHWYSPCAFFPVMWIRV